MTRCVWLALAVLGCNGGPDDYHSLKDEVFVPSCGFDTCHGAATGGLEMRADIDFYDNLVDAAVEGVEGEIRIVPGDVDNSYVIWKLEARDGIDGDAMPPPSGGLDPDKIERIKIWIEEGAPKEL